MNWLKFLFQKIKIRKSIKAPKESVIKDIRVKIEAIKKLPMEGFKKIKDYAKIENLYKKVQKKSNKRKIKKLDLLLNNNLPKGWNLTKQIIKNLGDLYIKSLIVKKQKQFIDEKNYKIN